MSDSWNILNKDRVIPNEEIAKLSLEDQILLAGVTCNSRLNTWRSTRPLWEACRLDYALIDAANITPIDAKVKFVDKLNPPFRCSYSDHFAYSVDLVVNSINNRKSYSSGANDEEKEAVYRELLAEISQYRKFTIPRQLLWRKFHFILSFATIIGMHIGIAFVVDVAAWVSVVFISIIHHNNYRWSQWFDLVHGSQIRTESLTRSPDGS